MPVVPLLLNAAEALRPVRVTGRARGWPVFRQDCAEYSMFYAPGCLCVVSLADAAWFEATLAPPQISPESKPSADAIDSRDWGAELWRSADRAMTRATLWQTEPFSPECLTLYMNNECNLRCVYCHTDPSPRPVERLELEAITAAAQVVAEHCRRKGRPLYVVFHGGGEPTLHRQRVAMAMKQLEAVANAHGVGLFRYVATNGVMTEQKARWLARCFDLVGLSCDGPPDIQNSQRPRWDGGDTSHLVERTAHILREEGRRFQVRTTITRATLDRQAEIVDYVCRQFLPEEIHYEPTYLGGRTNAAIGLDASYADRFVAHFLEARQVAQGYGVRLSSSGSRLGSIHGPYCHVFRHVVNLVPGGLATACFKITRADQVEAKGAAIGRQNGQTKGFEIEYPRVRALRQRLNGALPGCTECFNLYHCVRECPDYCPLDQDDHPIHDLSTPGFRCQVQKALAYATLRETAQRLWATVVAEKPAECEANAYGELRRIVHGTTLL